MGEGRRAVAEDDAAGGVGSVGAGMFTSIAALPGPSSVRPAGGSWGVAVGSGGVAAEDAAGAVAVGVGGASSREGGSLIVWSGAELAPHPAVTSAAAARK
ncbi:hypothetical protein [Sorangium sp. So ce117]|uniref:hypothetical protein n=1 Tax=Sorangium sp. So ce117 TaxID=3133277 RepID=UPI003F5F0250